MKLPDGLSGEDACALICGYGTSHYALKQRAVLQAGETLCVLGASGATGIAAVQIGKADGRQGDRASPRPTTSAPLPGRPAPTSCIGYDNLKDRLKEATGGNGVDVGFDPVGGEAFDGLSRSMALERPAAGHRLRLGHDPEIPGQPGAGQGLQRGRRVLGRLHRQGAAGSTGQHARADRLASRRQGQAGDRRQLSARRCRRRC